MSFWSFVVIIISFIVPTPTYSQSKYSYKSKIWRLRFYIASCGVKIYVKTVSRQLLFVKIGMKLSGLCNDFRWVKVNFCRISYSVYSQYRLNIPANLLSLLDKKHKTLHIRSKTVTLHPCIPRKVNPRVIRLITRCVRANAVWFMSESIRFRTWGEDVRNNEICFFHLISPKSWQVR